MQRPSILFLFSNLVSIGGVALVQVQIAQAASRTGGVYCGKSANFAHRIDRSGDMIFAVGGANSQGHIFSVKGLAKPHAGGWRYQVTSEDPDERCTIDISRANGGFDVDTVEGARCVNAGGFNAWSIMVGGLHFSASSRIKDVTKELDDEVAVLNLDCERVSSTASTSNLDVPIRGHMGDSKDACGTTIVIGLKSDGFLAVRSGPGPEFRKIDELHNGDTVHIFDMHAEWAGVVYGVPRIDCSSSKTSSTKYKKKGWIHRKWLDIG